MTKIDIITGFLGAGKTTLIKKLIEYLSQQEKIVLIENEFGDVNIDSGFLQDSGVEIAEISSGCILTIFRSVFLFVRGHRLLAA